MKNRRPQPRRNPQGHLRHKGPTHPRRGKAALAVEVGKAALAVEEGKAALAVEEGMIRNITNRVSSDRIGAFDAELGDFQAAGQIIDEMYKMIGYKSVIGTARAAIAPR